MKILATKICPACDGNQVQLHHSWDEYHGVRKVYTEQEFFLKLGYLPDEQRPPLVVPCSTCRGEGEVEAWQSLEAVLPLLWDAFRQFRDRNEAA